MQQRHPASPHGSRAPRAGGRGRERTCFNLLIDLAPYFPILCPSTPPVAGASSCRFLPRLRGARSPGTEIVEDLEFLGRRERTRETATGTSSTTTTTTTTSIITTSSGGGGGAREASACGRAFPPFTAAVAGSLRTRRHYIASIARGRAGGRAGGRARSLNLKSKGEQGGGQGFRLGYSSRPTAGSSERVGLLSSF